MKDRLSIPVALATGIVPGLGARRAPAPALTIVADPVLTAVQNQAYSFVAQVQNAVGEAELTIIDAAAGLSVTPMGDNYFLVAGPITAFGSFEMVLRAEDGLERTAFLGPFTVEVRWQTLQEAWGAKNKGLMDHGDLSNLTLVSGRIFEQHDPIVNATYSQSFSTSRPLHDARGFGVYDGNDDFLEYGLNPYFTGASPCHIIAVVRQDALVADTITRDVFGMGGNANSLARRLIRVVSSGVSRGRTLVGNGTTSVVATEASVDFSGVRLVVAEIGEAGHRVAVDGSFSSVASIEPATSATRARIGAGVALTAANFWQGGIAAIAVTDPLTSEEWNAGLPWLQAAAARFTA